MEESQKQRDNLILIGFMGTGKSAAGSLLAEKLKRKFIDLDQLIEENSGSSIAAIFEEQGEEHFRELESETLNKLIKAGAANLVIATGGGIVLREENRKLLKTLGKVILLTATLPEIIIRTSGDRSRPLLDSEDRLETIRVMLETRKPFYREHDYCFDTTGKDLESICAEIISALRLQ